MNGHIWRALSIACVPGILAAQVPERPLNVLPETATASLAASLDTASHHVRHIWRDTSPMTDDGAVHAYIEIPRGDRRKWEFNMRANMRAIDRLMPSDIGGYPVNYGFVPQTISYDGDPFDALVLGPPLQGGHVVRGAIVGLMMMEDEKGIDSKVVLSPTGPDGHPIHELNETEQERIAEYFRRYKRHETGKFSKVPGWSTPAIGQAYVTMTHAFFRECRARTGAPCRIGG